MSNASELQALRNDIDHAISSSRRKNAISLILCVVSVGLIAYWLYYAHTKFAAVDPNFAADYAQSQLTDYMPQAGTDLEASLKSYAPQFISQVESRLQVLPDRFADELKTRTQSQLDAAAPQIQDELYKSLKAGLDQAKANVKPGAKGADDSARFQSMLDALADTYRDESIKLVDQVHSKYTANGSDIVAYIQVLANNKNLDRREQLHRDMLQNFLVIAKQRAGGGNTP
jgi:hypothetical protein